jgi:ankyrin repeat protein
MKKTTFKYALYGIALAGVALSIYHYGGRWWAQRQINQIVFHGVSVPDTSNPELKKELMAEQKKMAEREFVEAACRNDEKLAKMFLRAGYSPNARNKHGLTPLHCAAGKGNLELATALIAAGADMKARSNEDDVTPLHFAAAYRKWELVKLFVKKGLSINEPSKLGTAAMIIGDDDALYRMAQLNPNGDKFYDLQEPLATSINMLSSLGATLDMIAPNGNTLMHHAAREHDVELMNTLLTKYGVDVNTKNNRGETPLIYAVKTPPWVTRHRSNNYLPAVEWLVKNGADKNARDQDGWSIALAAARHKELLALLSPDLNFNVADNNGDSIWSLPGAWEPVQFARTQATIGVPLMLDGRPGKGPLHVAAKDAKLDDTLYFLQRGVDPRQIDQDGLTPLHVVLQSSGGMGDVRKNRLLIAKALLDAGADVNARTPQGLTPLMMAENKPGEIIQLLLDHKADVNATAMENNKPLSVLDRFARRANTEGMELLVKAGARKATLN